MNKNIWMALAAASVMTACDYNEEYFEGFDSQEITDIKTGSIDFADWASLDKNSKPYKNKYFSSRDKAADYLPKWLDKKYFSADNGSSFKVTFDYREDRTELHNQFYGTTYHKFKNEDYKTIHGEGFYGPYLNERTNSSLYKVLKKKYPEAKEGDLVFAEYNYNAKAVPQRMDDPVYSFDFESLNLGELKSIKKWFVSATGNSWEIKSYDDEKYVSFTANKKGACEAWLVAPTWKVTDDKKKFGFDVNVGFWNANCLSVLISTDFDGENVSKATWKDITSEFTIPTEPKRGFGKFVAAGAYSLKDYVGKEVRIAFKYVGDGKNKKSTTYQIDNVIFGNDMPKLVKTTPAYAVYQKEAKGWYAVDEDRLLVLSPADYESMGKPGDKYNFSSSVPADEYLPNFLAKKVAYPLDGEEWVVMYKFYNKEVKVYSDSYIYSAADARWHKNTYMTRKTEQYVKNGGVWKFDPSVIVNLPAGKGNATVSAYYQAIVDWVWENIDKKELGITKKGEGYVTSYDAPTGSEYYFGATAYQNNIDLRPSKFRDQYKAGYEGMDDKQLQKTVMERLPQAFLASLTAMHPEAAPVEGVDVTYTVKFSVFDGSASQIWMIVYKVIGKGQFEYVKDSMKIVE